MSTPAYSEVSAARYHAQVTATADRLRALAEQVEQQSRATAGPTGGPDARANYLAASTRVLHAVVWGVANLGLDTLATAAAEVHTAREIEADLAAGR